jgi:hypothetical protein
MQRAECIPGHIDPQLHGFDVTPRDAGAAPKRGARARKGNEGKEEESE